MDTPPSLRLVDPARPVEPARVVEPVETPATREYWERVQTLRADLARLRPAN